MAQTVIGLDIGSWSIKAAVLDSGLRRQDLTDFREHHVPTDPDGNPMDDRGVLIRATLAGIRDCNAIITAAPGSRVMQRELELPFADDKRIKSVLSFQLDGQLPLPVEALVYDYTVLEELDPGARLLCSAVGREWLTGFLEELKEADADPKTVCLDSMATLHLVPKLREIGAIGPSEAEDGGDEDIAFIDIGHRTTTLTVIRGDQVETGRSLAKGGHQVTLALQQALGGDYHQAERLKHEGVRLDGQVPVGVEEPEHDRRVEIVAAALSPIVRDLRMSLHAHAQRTRRRVKRAFLFGGTTRMPGLIEAVGQGLGIDVTLPRISRLQWARSSGKADDNVAAKATALALRFSSGLKDVNFRQGDLAYESDFKAIRDRALWVGFLVVMLVAVFFTNKYLQLGRLEEQKELLVGQLESYTEEVLGKKSKDFELAIKSMEAPPKTEGEEVFPQMTALAAFTGVTEAQEETNETLLPSATGKPPGPAEAGPPKDGEGDGEEDAPKDKSETHYRVELEAVTITTKENCQKSCGNAVLRGEVNGIEALEEFTGRLKKNKCFREVATTDTHKSPTRDRSDWLRFNVTLDVLCRSLEDDADKKKAAAAKKKKAADKKASTEDKE